MIDLLWGEPAISEDATQKTTGITSVETSVGTSVETAPDTATRILTLLKIQPTLTMKTLAQHLGLSQRAVEMQIAKLKAAKRLRRTGPNKGGYWEILK